MQLDTTIFIDLFRGKNSAKQYLLDLKETIKISRVVQMELIFGSRSKNEMNLVKKQLASLGVEIIEIDSEISKLAGKLLEEKFHSHGLGIMDALIAATAISENEKLTTHNIKHFQFLDQLKVNPPY